MAQTAYFNLSIPAPRRLAMMRADGAWRNVRSWGLRNWQSAFGTLSAGSQEGSQVGFRTDYRLALAPEKSGRCDARI